MVAAGVAVGAVALIAVAAITAAKKWRKNKSATTSTSTIDLTEGELFVTELRCPDSTRRDVGNGMATTAYNTFHHLQTRGLAPAGARYFTFVDECTPLEQASRVAAGNAGLRRRLDAAGYTSNDGVFIATRGHGCGMVVISWAFAVHTEAVRHARYVISRVTGHETAVRFSFSAGSGGAADVPMEDGDDTAAADDADTGDAQSPSSPPPRIWRAATAFHKHHTSLQFAPDGPGGAARDLYPWLRAPVELPPNGRVTVGRAVMVDSGREVALCVVPRLLAWRVDAALATWRESEELSRLELLVHESVPFDPALPRGASDILSSEHAVQVRRLWKQQEADRLFERHRCVVAVRPGYRARGGRVLWDLGPVLVVYVWLKGIRPLDEEALPQHLCGLPVDVRTGCVRTAVGSDDPSRWAVMDWVASDEFRSLEDNAMRLYPGASLGAKEGGHREPGTLGVLLHSRNSNAVYALTAEHVVSGEPNGKYPCEGGVPATSPAAGDYEMRFYCPMEDAEFDFVKGVCGELDGVSMDAALLGLKPGKEGPDRHLLMDGEGHFTTLPLRARHLTAEDEE